MDIKMQKKYLSYWRVFEKPSQRVQSSAEQRGYAVDLMARNSLYLRRPLSHVRSVVDPAIRQRRIKFYFNEDGDLVGLVIWAYLVPDVAARVAEAGAFLLHDSEWTEGQEFWIVDFIAHPGYTKYIVADLRSMFRKSIKSVNYIRFKGENHSVNAFKFASSDVAKTTDYSWHRI